MRSVIVLFGPEVRGYGEFRAAFSPEFRWELGGRNILYSRHALALYAFQQIALWTSKINAKNSLVTHYYPPSLCVRLLSAFFHIFLLFPIVLHRVLWPRYFLLIIFWYYFRQPYSGDTSAWRHTRLPEGHSTRNTYSLLLNLYQYSEVHYTTVFKLYIRQHHHAM